MNKHITSPQNSYIKELVQLKEKSRIRKNSNSFLIEGLREISLAIKGGYAISTILVDFSILSEIDFNTISNSIGSTFETIEISNAVFSKLALRASTEGIIAVAQSKDLSLKSIQFLTKTPLILVAEAPEKPGNIGALLRTADAAGIDAVFIANPKTDLYNPNVIRSSVGCVFTTKIATGTTTEIISFLKENDIAMYGAALTASIEYQTVNYIKSSAIIVGTEATGLSEEWLQNTSQNIIIPMRGAIDSMNVSVSAAIIIFEAIRQRNP
ncbi:MAG: RNA methyltransferase [Lutibacter sp.]|uniref:TrmH family RNA methyltransferase n=1 Tax=Lutibacter sp. TaxID=1925666 RepID=UPI001852DC07|nr:TrmH family RNA methyltransferase [Lutibacter sp.]MBT8317565.1 RNA methyltransferase [Lutibacter sp.]NNJ58424.1 RNA methyltransferase [Lutibacter sp.]